MLVAHAAEGDREEAQPHAPDETMELDRRGEPGGRRRSDLQAGPRSSPAAAPLQAPAPAPINARGGTVVLDVGGGSTVPSLLGLSMREAIGTAHKAGFELQVVGSGTAREQQPPAGSYLPPGSKIAVRFTH